MRAGRSNSRPRIKGLLIPWGEDLSVTCWDKGMPAQRTFGQRAAPQPPAPPIKPRPTADLPAGSATPVAAAPVSLPPDGPSIEDEIQEWKKARTFRFPWRQFYVMAGLCFGIGSFVLPDTVSDDVQWLLYALAAASFYAGLHKRKNA